MFSYTQFGAKPSPVAAARLPWILNVDLELRIHKSLQLYEPRRSEQRVHRALILRLARRSADARKPMTRATAMVLEDREEQALVLRALRADVQAGGDPVVAEFLGHWGGGG